jgi:hypothetical protein
MKRAVRWLPAGAFITMACWKGRFVSALLGTALLAAAVHAQPGVPEYRLKAAFLVKFPQFVDWPAAALDGRKVVDICVVSPTPFGTDLHELVKGETIRGYPLGVRLVTGEASAATCHVLFVPDARLARARAILRHVAERPVLTVGDRPEFLEAGGIINMKVVDDRVRFEVDLPAAERAGVRLSSQLLRLAESVRSTIR